MCGRYVRKSSAQDLRDLFDLAELPALGPHYNAVRVPATGTGREAALFRWGLIPSWPNDPKIDYKLINARSENAAEKPSFRSAFKSRRCLIPADGFYEWKKAGKQKQPYYIGLNDGRPFALAGLWERWKPDEGDPVETCTILTTEANALVKPMHDRMPVIMHRDDFDRGLHPNGDAKALLKPYPAEEMAAYPVSPMVNSPKNQGPKCIEPIELAEKRHSRRAPGVARPCVAIGREDRAS